MDFEALADFAEELNFDELLSVNGGCGGGCGGGGGGSSSTSGCGGAGTSSSSSSSSGCGGNHVPTVEELIDAWNNPDNVKSREDANKCWAEKYGYDPKKGKLIATEEDILEKYLDRLMESTDSIDKGEIGNSKFEVFLAEVIKGRKVDLILNAESNDIVYDGTLYFISEVNGYDEISSQKLMLNDEGYGGAFPMDLIEKSNVIGIVYDYKVMNCGMEKRGVVSWEK